MGRWHYCASELVEAIRGVGVEAGDIVYTHIAPLKLGLAKEVMAGENIGSFFYNAVREVIGPAGTFITPTYTYSFCNGEIYDPVATPGTVGTFGEWLRKQPGASRSADPIFSLAGIGPEVASLFKDLPRACFGEDCVYERMERRGAKICNIGLTLHFTTAFYHLQRRIGVPYRFDKIFSGFVRYGEDLRKENWIYYVRTMIPQAFPNFERMHELALEKGVAARKAVGAGFIVSASIKNLYALGADVLRRDPWFMASGPPCEPVVEDMARTGRKSFVLSEPEEWSAGTIIKDLWALPRDIVSDGYDAALDYLARLLPMSIHSYPTGIEAFTWIVPERWLCRSARLEDKSGKTIFSTDDNELHCMRYSLPFMGAVSREELMAHLYSNPAKPDRIPYVFKYYERSWGLCCPDTLKRALNDDVYHVYIDTDFSISTLKVGEIVIPGESEECIVFCAHLCHPWQVSDGLSGVAGGMEVMRNLMARPGKTRYTYRMLILPESIGSACWLSHNTDLTPSLKGGIFLEMLSSRGKFAFKLPPDSDAYISKVLQYVMGAAHNAALRKPHESPLNDERMFNAYGVDVPMGCILRHERETGLSHIYHTDQDNLENADFVGLKQSIDVLMEIIYILEYDCVPVPRFQGELFYSRVSVLYSDNIRAIIALTVYMNGRRSLLEIAEKSGVDFPALLTLSRLLEKDGWASLSK